MTDYEYDEIMEAIENLAAMVQREFLVMREDMAKESKALREEMSEGLAAVRSDMAKSFSMMDGKFTGLFTGLRDEMRVGFTLVHEEVVSIHEDIHDLKEVVLSHELRIDRLEKKTGIL